MRVSSRIRLNPPAYPRSSIIAVHGLGPRDKDVSAHAWDTWRSPAGPEGRLWIRDDLPKHIPGARVFLFEYDATLAFDGYRLMFLRHANELLEKIRSSQDGLEERSIVFLGHSLGGLLVEQALFNARYDPRYKSIKDATSCVAFFATPYAEDDMTLDSLGKVASDIAAMMGFQKGESISKTLENGWIFGDLVGRPLNSYADHTISIRGSFDKVIPTSSTFVRWN